MNRTPAWLAASLAAMLALALGACRPGPGENGERAAADSSLPSLPLQAPRRIASIIVSGDALLSALRIEPARIVSVSSLIDDAAFSEIPGAFPGTPRVGVDFEKLVSLQPDFVIIGSFIDPVFVQRVRLSGLRYLIYSEPRSLTGTRTFLRAFADSLGVPDRGDSLVRWFDSAKSAVETRVRSCSDRPTVLYWDGGFTAGDSSTVDELIEVAGGRNATRQMFSKPSAAISVEDVLALDPDWILRSSWKGGSLRLEPLPAAFHDLRAVREGHVVLLPGSLVLSTSHLALRAADSLSRVLHPRCP